MLSSSRSTSDFISLIILNISADFHETLYRGGLLVYRKTIKYLCVFTVTSIAKKLVIVNSPRISCT